MIKLGGKGKVVMRMLPALSPSKVGGRNLRRDNLLDFPLSRWPSPWSEVVADNNSGRGEGAGLEGRSVGDIRIYNRATGENLELDDGEKESWWMPHPVTGVFSPVEQEAIVQTTMGENKITIRRSDV